MSFDTFVGLPLNQSIASAAWDSADITWDVKTYLVGTGSNTVKVASGIPGVVLGNYTALSNHIGQAVFFTPLAGRDGAQYVAAISIDSSGVANTATASNCVRAQAGAYGMLYLDDLGGTSTQTSAACSLTNGNEYCLELVKTTDASGRQYRATVYNSSGGVRGTQVATQTITISTARTGRLVQVISGTYNYVTLSRVESIDSAAASTPVTFSGPVPTRNGSVGTAASFTNAGFFAGSATPFSYSSVGTALPAGLTLSSSTGIISGTPTAAGTSSGIVVRATDANSATADTNAYSIVIAASNAAPTFPGSIANITGTAGTAITPVNVSGQFSDSDTLTYSASPAGTAWPSGLTIDSATGIISGTVAQSTTTGMKVRATDTASQTVDSNAFSVTISAAAQASTGTFKTLPLANNTGTLYAAGTSVAGQWHQGGRIGSAATSITYVTATTAADGTVTFTGLPTGAGYLLAAILGANLAADKPYYQSGTVA